MDRLVGLAVSVSDYIRNFECGSCLEWGPPSLLRVTGEVVDLIKKVDIDRLDGA